VISDWGGTCAQDRDAFGFAVLASFGFVFELLIVKEQLLPGGEDKVVAAINTLQNLVLKFHGNAPFGPWPHGALRVEASRRECGTGSYHPTVCDPWVRPAV
jgi:hypothetical protein